MTRLIERWFPCREVSENSRSGWGSGNTERELFTWFASRPLVQAKAAVICSLLPWPDDLTEQERLQDLVRKAMADYDAAHSEIVAEINKHYPDGPSILDPFAGRAIIPSEAARLGIKAWGIEYSPVATLAGTLLADYPMRDWSQEPPLPFEDYQTNDLDRATTPRLLYDVQYILHLIGRSYESEMDKFYPKVNGKRPWGYLWAITIPCVNCGHRFPVTGSYELRRPNHRRKDPGQSYYIEADRLCGKYQVTIHNGTPRYEPTFLKKRGARGRVAVCSFCHHVHSHKVHTRLMSEGKAKDVLLIVADVDSQFGKLYRKPVSVEFESSRNAGYALNQETPFSSVLSAVPSEKSLGSTGPRDYARYGYYTYGDFCNARQTLGYIKLARIISAISKKLLDNDVSEEYVATLSGYAGSVMVRMIRRATRGARLEIPGQKAGDIFKAGPPVPFGYDYIEIGCGKGPGSWLSIAKNSLRILRTQLDRIPGHPAYIQQGTATALPIPDTCLDAVVTDPPYESMVEFSDASDLFYVWLKRALIISHPEFGINSNSAGVQEKEDEAVVKMTWNRSGDHRTPKHYTRSITNALVEARRVIKSGGVVSIMFGHDDPDVWNRFLTTISDAGLVLTGSWPARTEAGSQLGRANIETTLTLVCRPVSPDRPEGQMLKVDREVKQEILDRISLWQTAGLALRDQRMASYGPAMEVVGRYSKICDKAGNPATLGSYLAKARRYVEEAAEIRIGNTPLEVFEPRSHFGLFWTYMYGRTVVPGSEVRWLRLGWEMTDQDTVGLIEKQGQGYRLIYASEIEQPRERNTVIDVALAVAGAGKSIRDIATVLVDADRVDDDLLWDSVSHLAQHVTEADRDGEVWTWAVRNRSFITGSSQNIEEGRTREEEGGIQTGML